MLDGLHFHAGSNSLDAAAIGANMRNCAELAHRLVASLGRLPGRLIFDAGFGVPYHEGQVALDLAEVAAKVQAALAPLVSVADVAMDLEPGRWLVAPAGQMLTRVLTRKAGRAAVSAICDGGFNANLAACGMMGSVVRRNWPIRNVTMPDGVPEKITLAGPLCTSIDLLARDLDLAHAAVGDLLAVGLSGAYGPTASPQGFMSQPQVREMIWDGHTQRDETPGRPGRSAWRWQRNDRAAVRADPGLSTLGRHTAAPHSGPERITHNLFQIEGDPRQASRWLCCVSPLIR